MRSNAKPNPFVRPDRDPERGSCDPYIHPDWEEQPDERPEPITVPEEEPIPVYVPEKEPALI